MSDIEPRGQTEFYELLHHLRGRAFGMSEALRAAERADTGTMDQRTSCLWEAGRCAGEIAMDIERLYAAVMLDAPAAYERLAHAEPARGFLRRRQPVLA
jgi:hypothetical protein